MNWDQIEGNWKQMKGQFRQRWGKLTGGDLEQAQGARERLIGLLQERYGMVKEKAQQELDSFVQSLEGSDDDRSLTAAAPVPPHQAEPTPTGHEVRQP